MKGRIITFFAVMMTLVIGTGHALAESKVEINNYYDKQCRVTIAPVNILFNDYARATIFYVDPTASGTPATCLNTDLYHPCITKIEVKCGVLYEKELTYTANYNSACNVTHRIRVSSSGEVSKD